MSELDTISESGLTPLEGSYEIACQEEAKANLEDTLQLLVEQYPCSPLELVKVIAPHDPEIAKSLVAGCNIEPFRVYLELSKHCNEIEAQDILNDLRRQYDFSTKELVQIYEEEVRRGFLGADRTYQLIKERANKKLAGRPEWLGYLSVAIEGENVSEILEKVHQEMIQDLAYSIAHHSLCRLLEVEASCNSPLALKTLEALRSFAESFRVGNSQSDDSWGEHEFFDVWVETLIVEVQSPYLSDQFSQDFAGFLSNIERFKTRFPGDESDTDYILSLLFESLVTTQPKDAEKILLLTSRDFYFVRNMALLFEKNPSNLTLDRETLLTEIDKCLAQETFPVYQVCALVDAFRCIASVHSLDLALPYLERAKTLAAEIIDEDCERQEAFCSILQAELDYELPSFKVTLEELRETIKRASYVDSDFYPLVLEAEVKLLT